MHSHRAENTQTIRLGLRKVISSLSAACPSIIEVRSITCFRNGDLFECYLKHEIPKLKAAHPALGDMLPDAQTNDSTKEALGSDTDGE